MNLLKKIRLFSEMVAGDFRFVFLPLKPIRIDLKISGKVYDLEIRLDAERNVVKIIAKAEMEVLNECNETIAFINPKYLTQSTVKTFAVTEVDCKAENYLFNSSFSSDEPVVSKEFNEILGKILDDKPIDDLVYSISANEKVNFTERIFFEFDADKKKKRWEEVGWQNFRSKINEIWFRYSYKLPEEIYLLKPKLIELFPDHFGGIGQVPICVYKNKTVQYSHHSLKTEPIFIDFRKAKIDETK